MGEADHFASAGKPIFSTRAELMAWARQRLRYPDPSPDAKLKALEDIRRVTMDNTHLLALGKEVEQS